MVSQLSCYWRPAGSDVAEETLPLSVDPRGPNAVLQPVDCSLSIKMHTRPGGASVVEAASVVDGVNVQLHQQQVSCSIVCSGQERETVACADGNPTEGITLELSELTANRYVALFQMTHFAAGG